MDLRHPLGSEAAAGHDIPIIDLSPVRSPHIDQRQRLARSIYEACTQVGFFYIKNHGIPESLIEEAHEASKRFFALPEEQKMKVYIGKSKKFRGYLPLGAEKSTGVDNDALAEEDDTGAHSEAYDIGYETAMDFTKNQHDRLPTDPYALYGDNQWPDDDILPGFTETYMRYCATVLELSRSLMKIFALALDLPESYFDRNMRYPGVTSRMLHYPPQRTRDEAREGLGAHTDYECFTILSQGNVPGLQVLSQDGKWIHANPIPGTFVVNIADCLSIWTNKRFKSTIHRVVNMTGEERYTIPFFFGVDYNTTISVLENQMSESEPACSEPFKAGKWVRDKLSRAYVGYSG